MLGLSKLQNIPKSKRPHVKIVGQKRPQMMYDILKFQTDSRMFA